MLSRARRPAFTLVELLVVIAIIVVLLALLVPGLTRAIKYAERSKCGSNQRNIAQSCIGYSQGSKFYLPPGLANYSRMPVGNTTTELTSLDLAYAMDYRVSKQTQVTMTNPRNPALAAAPRRPLSPPLATTLNGRALAWATDVPPPPGAGNFRPPLGLGILVAAKLLPSAKLGEVAHCPTLNTSSATPTRDFGTDNIYTIASTNNASIGDDVTAGAGGSYYEDPNQSQARIIGSYNYRGLSYGLTHGGGAINYQLITPSFVLVVDNPDLRYGQKFCHKDGYNVGYGDGHVSYFLDPPTKRADQYREFSEVERLIPGHTTNPPVGDNNNPTSIDGRSGWNPNNPSSSVDERIFEYLSTQKTKTKTN